MFLDVLFPLHVKKIIFVDADLVRISLSTFSFLPNCMEHYSLHAIRWSFSPFFLYRPPAVTPPLKGKNKTKRKPDRRLGLLHLLVSNRKVKVQFAEIQYLS